ncbi:MAG: Fic family protein [Bacteroidales bacterium]|nr:Fic family protein [Bacteroidales bacterium]
MKVPSRLENFCNELNLRRNSINKTDIISINELSFWAHYNLVTIHPWADGNGRMSRLLMKLIQFEFEVLPNKVLSDDKVEYIQSLVDSRENENPKIFIDMMIKHHINHLKKDIDNYKSSILENENLSKMSKRNHENVQKKLSERQLIIINLIKTERLTLSEMSKRLNVSIKTIQREILHLRDLGIIDRVGGKTYGEWIVK